MRPVVTAPPRRVAVITGAGGGIGGACVRLLSAQGFSTILVGRTLETLESVARQVQPEAETIPFVCDVRDPERVARLAQEVEARFGRVDLLVNSAGGQFSAPAQDITTNGWSAVVSTNLDGTFYVCHALFPFLREAKGSIVNVVANIWQRAAPTKAHSGAARAGVVSLTRTLALEWAGLGIRSNAVSPGVTDTPGLRSHTPDLEPVVAQVPLGRAATAEEVAEAVLFLARASYITGEVLVVDGGLQLA